jgi:hypothetical protein
VGWAYSHPASSKANPKLSVLASFHHSLPLENPNLACLAIIAFIFQEAGLFKKCSMGKSHRKMFSAVSWAMG